jgi:hypothetical protein
VINELLDGQTEALSHVDDLFENFHSPKAFVVEKDPTGGKFYVRSFRLDPHVHHQTSRPHSFFTTSKTSKDFMKLPSAEEEHLTLSHQRPSFQFHGSSVGTASCDCRGRRIKRALGLNKFKQRSSLNGFHDTNCGSNISHYSTCSSNSSMNPSPSLTPPPAPPRSIKSILKPLMKNITHSHVVTNSSGGHFHLAENEDKTVMVGMNMYDDQDLPLLDRCNNTFIDQFDQVINVPVVDHERPKLNMPSIIQEDQEMTHTSEVNSQAQVHTKGEKYKKNHRIDDDDDNDEEEEEEEKEEEDDGDVIKSNYSFKNLKDIDFQKPKSSTITTTTTPTSTSMTEMMNESNYHHTSSSSSSSSSSNKSTNPQYGSGLLGYKSNSANRLVGHDGMVNRMKTSRRMNNSKTQNSMSDLTRRLRDARSRIPYEFRGEVFVPVKKSSLGNFLSKNKRVRFDLTRYCHEFEVESNESDDDKQQEQYHVDYHHTFIEYTSESDSDAEEEHVEEYDSDSMEYFV